jgi:hypothetical protein
VIILRLSDSFPIVLQLQACDHFAIVRFLSNHSPSSRSMQSFCNCPILFQSFSNFKPAIILRLSDSFPIILQLQACDHFAIVRFFSNHSPTSSLRSFCDHPILFQSFSKFKPAIVLRSSDSFLIILQVQACDHFAIVQFFSNHSPSSRLQSFCDHPIPL